MKPGLSVSQITNDIPLAPLSFSVLALAILIAMIIATAKGTLVVGFFMHLLHEKKMIYLILIITLVFLMSLFFITFGTIGDQVGVKIVSESDSSGIH